MRTLVLFYLGSFKGFCQERERLNADLSKPSNFGAVADLTRTLLLITKEHLRGDRSLDTLIISGARLLYQVSAAQLMSFLQREPLAKRKMCSLIGSRFRSII